MWRFKEPEALKKCFFLSLSVFIYYSLLFWLVSLRLRNFGNMFDWWEGRGMVLKEFWISSKSHEKAQRNKIYKKYKSLLQSAFWDSFKVQVKNSKIGARKVKSFFKDFHETCEKFICLWKELLLLCQSLNWSFIWQNPSLQHDIKSALEFRMSHLGGFHSKVAMRFFFMAKCILILICANL